MPFDVQGAVSLLGASFQNRFFSVKPFLASFVHHLTLSGGYAQEKNFLTQSVVFIVVVTTKDLTLCYNASFVTRPKTTLMRFSLNRDTRTALAARSGEPDRTRRGSESVQTSMVTAVLVRTCFQSKDAVEKGAPPSADFSGNCYNEWRKRNPVCPYVSLCAFSSNATTGGLSLPVQVIQLFAGWHKTNRSRSR